MTRFYLGTHVPNWLNKVDVPLFVSRRTLCKGKNWKPATCRWALDSGGFSELTMFGRWTVSPRAYVAEVRRWSEQIGGLDWAAIQDWMCEPVVLAKTGKDVLEHQERTINSYDTLVTLDRKLPWTPVIQGWVMSDYLRHIEMYAARGVDLRQFPVVGIGSVCRRQSTDEIATIIRRISGMGIKLHGFGVKRGGLQKTPGLLKSADSLAWSFGARRKPPIPGHTHKNCANCMEYALKWRADLLRDCEGLE